MKWVISKHDGVPLVEWLYSQRNVVDERKHFRPTLADLTDPFLFHDMLKAVEFIADSIKAKKKIFIHGDFDADGITATSILWLFLHKHMGADVTPYIPSRFEEGYGLSEESLSAIISQGGEVVISVDCGVKDIELVGKYAKQLDFVITDHHTLRKLSEEKLKDSKIVNSYLISSKAKAVVHPQLTSNVFSEICGAMVSFQLCSALNKQMNLGLDMNQFVDLCSIGTVCDVMPLLEDNRIIVQLGLERLNRNPNLGIQKLLDSARLKGKKITAYHLGYVVGPRLNASGRLGDALDAVRLLTTSSDAFATKIAAKLEALNNRRKELTEEYFKLAEKELLDRKADKLFIYFGSEWPEGLLGLIAGKLAEKYNLPVIIGTNAKQIKASARSQENFNITEFIKDHEQYLEKYGGHAQAAGLTVKSNNLDSFLQSIRTAAENLAISRDEKLLFVDGVVDGIGSLRIEEVRKIMLLEPFGNKNPKPLLYLPNVLIKNFTYMGSNKEHLKFVLTDKSNATVEALIFGEASRFSNLVANPNLPIELVITLEIDEWNGSTKVSLRVVDYRQG